MEGSEALSFTNALIPFAIIVFIIAVGVVLLNQQFRKNLYRQQLEKEAMKVMHQQELLRSSIHIQEQERKRIARDLHDELGASLSMGRMQLLQLERSATATPEKLAALRQLIETALASTRRISHELMPLQLSETGLKGGLLSLAATAEETGSLEVRTAISAGLGKLDWALELALYRMCSELLNNTLKHANAKGVDFSLIRESDQLFFQYADDGKGLHNQPAHSGLGLKSLEGRVQALNGVLDYGNREEGGFFAHIRIPLSA